MSRCPCAHCGEAFTLRPQNPNQTYCSKAECQRVRKRLWQKEKLNADADYRENQRQSQKRWRENNPEYWKRWRAAHPDYVARNRKLQMARNRKSRPSEPVPFDASLFAKMDVSNEETDRQSGTYRIVPVNCKDGRVNAGFLCEISRLL